MVTPLEGNLIRTVNVNVIPKIKVAKNNIKLGYSTFSEVPDFYDFEGITDMSNMFYLCSLLNSIPLIDTSNVTNMYCCFYYCSNLTTIPLFNTSNVTSMERMFYNCSKLTSLPQLDTSKVTNMSNMFYECRLTAIPLFNTSNVTNMERMFYNCRNLLTIPQIDTSNVTTMTYMFSGCSNLTSVPPLNASKVTSINYPFGTSNNSTLTDFGGLVGLKTSMANYGFNMLPNLTYQSCINVLNGLYDFTSNDETPSSSQGKLKVHSNFLTTVGDEISIGTNKGWTITS